MQKAYAAAYEQTVGYAPNFTATHAGLECGIFYARLKELGRCPDIISLGPNMHNIHTTKETLEADSVQRVYETLKSLLKVVCNQ